MMHWLCMQSCHVFISAWTHGRRMRSYIFLSFFITITPLWLHLVGLLSLPSFLSIFLHNCGVISVGQGSDHWFSLFTCFWKRFWKSHGRPTCIKTLLSIRVLALDKSLCRILQERKPHLFPNSALLLSEATNSHLPLPCPDCFHCSTDCTKHHQCVVFVWTLCDNWRMT